MRRGPRPTAARIAAALGLLAALAAVPAQAAGAPGLAPAGSGAGEVIVRFKADAPTTRKHALAAGASRDAVHAALEQRAQALGARLGRALASGAAISERMQVVRAAGIDAATLARQLAEDPEVEFAVPNARKRRLAPPADPLYGASPAELRSNGLALQAGPASGQWYLRAPDASAPSAIDVEPAWARTRGSAGVTVAMLDTGVRFEHPDLGRAAGGGKLLPGYDFVSNAAVANDGDGRDADPSDPGDWITAADAASATFKDCSVESSSWHGTATASLVGALTDNGIGMAGTAPGVPIQPVRVLGKCYGDDADILAAMRWAAGIDVPGVPRNDHPARIVNMSLGASGTCSQAYQTVIDELAARGVTVVAAAGNSAGGAVGEPANCRGVVAVLALRHAGTKVGFSDLGPEIAIAAPGGNCVNVAAGSSCLYPILAARDSGTQAPAGSIWSDSYGATVGTSYAAPLVAGVAALMLSQRPQLSVAQLRAHLQGTARPFPSSGADNGPTDPAPVARCAAPQSAVLQ